jgi:hypothetical protein
MKTPPVTLTWTEAQLPVGLLFKCGDRITKPMPFTVDDCKLPQNLSRFFRRLDSQAIERSAGAAGSAINCWIWMTLPGQFAPAWIDT